MLKIGGFSKLSKVTIKALRYYEKEGLLIPRHIDVFNGYRYYDVRNVSLFTDILEYSLLI